LSAAGEWQVTIGVSGLQGNGSTSFRQQVLPGDGFNWWLVGAGGLLLLVVVSFWAMSRRQRRLRPQASAADAARSKV
jgi:hypothetical protein